MMVKNVKAPPRRNKYVYTTAGLVTMRVRSDPMNWIGEMALAQDLIAVHLSQQSRMLRIVPYPHDLLVLLPEIAYKFAHGRR